MHLEHATLKGLDALIDEHRNDKGFEQNVRAAAFYPVIISQPQEKDAKEKPTEPDIVINFTISRTTENNTQKEQEQTSMQY